MLELVIAALVVVWVGYMIIKKYLPQTILIVAGLVLLSAAALLGHPLLAGKQSCGAVWLDVFKTIQVLFSGRVAGLGLTLMAIAGFARYMEYVGASKALYAVVANPLKKIHSPYILLVLSFFVTQILVLFIPSHAGLGLLLMVTMYPILIRRGVSKLSALGVIGCCQFIDIGPGSGNAILAASTIGINPAVYFVKYQLPISCVIIAAVAITHFFVQRWWDRREQTQSQVFEAAVQTAAAESDRPPLIYAVLPVIPMLLILGFSPLFHTSVKMDVVTAMFISTFVSMIFEYFRTKNMKEVFASLQYFYQGMGKNFAAVVSLIVSGEIFASGLLKIGAVDALIGGAQNAGLGARPMILLMSLIIAVCAFLMGSGNAAFFSFAALTPKIAEFLKVDIATILLPMQIMTSFGRVVSPITAAIVAISGIAGVSPVQVVKRTAIPMAVAALINSIYIFIS